MYAVGIISSFGSDQLLNLSELQASFSSSTQRNHHFNPSLPLPISEFSPAILLSASHLFLRLNPIPALSLSSEICGGMSLSMEKSIRRGEEDVEVCGNHLLNPFVNKRVEAQVKIVASRTRTMPIQKKITSPMPVVTTVYDDTTSQVLLVEG